MNFNELNVGDFLFFKYDSTTIVYIYIDKIEDGQVFYHEIRILHRKQEFIYIYEVCQNIRWDDKDFIFMQFKNCNENELILIEYIFEYKVRIR